MAESKFNQKNPIIRQEIRLVKKFLLLGILLTCLTGLSVLFPQYTLVGMAQSGINVTSNYATVTLPENIIFNLDTNSAGNITSITLEYGTNSQACVVGVARQKIIFSSSNKVTTNWVWNFKTGGGSLPPGAQVWWLWEIKDDSGNVFRTEKQFMTVEDDRLNWKTVENDKVKVVWSEGGNSFGKRMLQIGTDSINRLAQNAGIKPPGQIRLTIFPSQESLIAALLFVPEWTGGVAFPEYSTTAMEIPVNADENWKKNVIPHELAHLVTGQLTFNCLGSFMPTWLSEGISVFNEGENTDIDLEAPISALKNGKLPPLRNYSAGFSADPGEALLAYGYSGVIVTYLIQTYGPEKLAELLSSIQKGMLINPALKSAYGFDTDGLDETWRTSLGYSANTGGTSAAPSPTHPPTSVPTLALATSAFGSGARPNTSTPQPTVELESAIEPTNDTRLVSTQTPTQTPVNLSAPVNKPLNTAQPDGKAPSPLSCLGGNLSLGFSLSLIAAVISRKTFKTKSVNKLNGD